jgi:LDH2 family malate/lactate/ureidoglycolate dehydrogenase
MAKAIQNFAVEARMTAERIRLSVPDARALGEAALRAIGYDDAEARIIADHVIDAALCGYEYSGLAKILNLPEHHKFRLPRRPMRPMRETDVSIAFDGGNNVGMLALYYAAEAAVKKAARHGIALVTVNDAWMSGRSAYFVEMIAKAGLIGIHTAASSRLVAPPGGLEAVLGTNPIAIAVPSANGPIVLDMGTSAFMMTEVMLRERLGEPLPEGVAIGPDGAPTRDAGLARRGALLPFGGYKGFGLALMIQALGVLAGTESDQEADDGYLFIAFRPELIGPADVFNRRMTELIERVKATPREAGLDEIRIPSERAFRTRERLLAEGLEIDRLVFDALNALRAKS